MDFSVKFSFEEGLWFATSDELNFFIALPNLDEVCGRVAARARDTGVIEAAKRRR